MAYAEIEGFDHQIKDYYWYDGFAGEGSTALVAFDTGRDGTGKSTFYNDSSSMRHMAHSLFTPLPEMAFGYAYKCGTTSTTSLFRLLQLDSSIAATGNAYAAAPHLYLVMPTGSNGSIELRHGNGTLLATAVGPFDVLVWNHFGVEVKIDDAAGYFRLYLNGDDAPVIDYTGDTRNGGADANVRALRFGQGKAGGRVDDFYLQNTVGGTPTVVGDVKILTSRPMGNGAANQWTGSDGNSADNYLLVDDDSTTSDYVSSPTSGQKDLYAMTDLPTPPAGSELEVLAVQVSAYAAKTDAGSAKDLLGVLRSAGGTEVEATIAPAASITASYQLFRGPIRTTDPDGAPWTKTTFDATQAGVKVGT